MKTSEDIQKTLKSAHTVSLGEDEKRAIKAQLLSYARSTSAPVIPDPIVSPWNTLFVRGTFAFAVFALVFVSTVNSASQSLPGEPLYALKVHVIEDVVELSKLSPMEKATYQVALMETRFDELRQLANAEEEATPETLAQVAEQIHEHIESTSVAMDSNEAAEISHTKKMETLQKLTTLTRAQSRLVEETPRFTSISEDIDEGHDDAQEALHNEVEEFTTEEPERVVSDYLSGEIVQTEALLLASTTDSALQDDVARHLTNMSESLIEGDTQEALSSIIKAQQVIEVDVYLNEAGLTDTDDEIEQ